MVETWKSKFQGKIWLSLVQECASQMRFGGHIFDEALDVEGLKNALLACFCLKQVPCNLEA